MKKPSKKRKKTPADQMPSEEPMYRFIQSLFMEDLDHLYDTCTEVEYRRPRSLQEVDSVKGLPTRILESEIHAAGLEYFVEVTMLCVVPLMKAELDMVPDFSRRSDVAHLLALVLAYSYNQGLEVLEVALGLLPVPNGLSLSHTSLNWPDESQMSSNNYSLQETDVTREDLLSLQHQEYLADQVNV